MAYASWTGSAVKLVKYLAIGDTVVAGVSCNDLAKPIWGCARTIAAAVEQLLLPHAHAAIARGFASQLNVAARETSGNDPQRHPDLRDRPAAFQAFAINIPGPLTEARRPFARNSRSSRTSFPATTDRGLIPDRTSIEDGLCKV